MGGHHLAVSQLRLDMQRDGGSAPAARKSANSQDNSRSEEHTSELQSPDHLVCRLLLEKKNQTPELESGGDILLPLHFRRHVRAAMVALALLKLHRLTNACRLRKHGADLYKPQRCRHV